MKTSATREQIIEAADQLFYQQGFAHTSFSDIAGVVGISRGNFYYHFKSKDEILDAVINERLQNTQDMLDMWEEAASTPAARIRSYIHILLTNRDKIMRYGCPVGTLCGELAKLDHCERTESIRLFDLFRTWLRHQFTQLGHKEDADRLAMHVLAWSQGVATLANAYEDKDFIDQEIQMICTWLEAYTPPAKRPQHSSDALH